MSALYTGVSGMLSHQTRMDAVANNIANVNTTGYKSNRVLFAETMHELLRAGTSPSSAVGGSNPASVGLGVQVAGTDRNFAQGSLQATGRTTDIALQGNGLIPVTDGQTVFYTRDGALGLDANGELIHLASGMKVVTVTPGADPTSAGPTSTLRVPLGESVAQATTSVNLTGNLDSRTTDGEAYEVTMHVYDSLGAGHDVALSFTRNAATGNWTVTGASADGTVTVGAPGTLSFDSNGMPTADSLPLELTLTSPNGAASTIAMNVSTEGVTQQAQGSSVALRSQDGVPPGTLNGISFDKDGSVIGVYSNGMRRNLGQVLTAVFTNPAGLEAAGSSLYAAGANSGAAVFGVPGTDGRGAVVNGQLEGSNVNLAQEFAEMIVTQRGFQANSRVVTTADQMLQELMNTAR